MVALLQAIIDCLQTVSLFALLSLPIGFALLGVLFLVWPRRLPSFAEWMQQRWRHPRLVALTEILFGLNGAALVVYGYGEHVLTWMPTNVFGYEVSTVLIVLTLFVCIPILLIWPIDRRYTKR